MNRRDFMKITALCGVGAALPLGAAEKATEAEFVSTTYQVALPDDVFKDISYLSYPRGMLARVLLSDIVPKGRNARYVRDMRSNLHQWHCSQGGDKYTVLDIDLKGDQPPLELTTYHENETNAPPTRDGASFYLPAIPAPKSGADEDHLIQCMLSIAAHEAALTGRDHSCHCYGKLSSFALIQASKCLQWHDLEAAYVIAHPCMFEQFDALRYGHFDKRAYTSPVGPLGCIYSLDVFHEDDHFHATLLLSQAMDRDHILVTAAPEYVGVRAMFQDGKIGLAVCNDYAVAQIRVREPIGDDWYDGLDYETLMTNNHE